MQFVNITSNGVKALTANNAVDYKEVSIHAPAVIGGATISIGWLDDTGTFVPYLNGALLAGESSKFNCGVGTNVVASIAGYTADFKIGVAG